MNNPIKGIKKLTLKGLTDASEEIDKAIAKAYAQGKKDGKANKEIEVIKSRQLGYDEGKANKEAYAKQKVEEALKKAKTDYIGAFNLGCKAGEKRINKQKQIEVLERVRDCFNEIVSFEDDLDEIVGVFNKQLEQRIKKLKGR